MLLLLTEDGRIAHISEFQVTSTLHPRRRRHLRIEMLFLEIWTSLDGVDDDGMFMSFRRCLNKPCWMQAPVKLDDAWQELRTAQGDDDGARGR